jgi:16S rRNA (uracil1498-N3)-methyltransferase
MRRFFAEPDNFDNGIVTLSADETRHLRDVLRLQIGDEVYVFNGVGREYQCTISEISKKYAKLLIIEEMSPTCPESPLDLTLAATVLNGEKYDLIVQKTVELGVKRLVPLITARCEVKLKDAAKRVERWRRIALEATKQSGRATIMEIADPAELQEIVANAALADLIMFSERDGGEFSTINGRKKMTALIGPKGGWDDSELERARSWGVNVVTLGGRILRAETAAIAMTSILQHRFGDLK